MLEKNKKEKQKEIDIFNNMPKILDFILPDELQERKAELYNIKKKKHIKMFHHLAKQSPFLFKGVKKQNENIDKLLNNLINLVEGKK